MFYIVIGCMFAYLAIKCFKKGIDSFNEKD